MASAASLIKRFREAPPSSKADRASASELWWKEPDYLTAKSSRDALSTSRLSMPLTMKDSQSQKSSHLLNLSLDLDALIEKEIEQLSQAAKSQTAQQKSKSHPWRDIALPKDDILDEDTYRSSIETLGSTGLQGLFQSHLQLELHTNQKKDSTHGRSHPNLDQDKELTHFDDSIRSLSDFIKTYQVTVPQDTSSKEDEGLMNPTFNEIIQKLDFDMKNLTHEYDEKIKAEDEQKKMMESYRKQVQNELTQQQNRNRLKLIENHEENPIIEAIPADKRSLLGDAILFEDKEGNMYDVIEHLRSLNQHVASRAQQLARLYASATDVRLDPIDIYPLLSSPRMQRDSGQGDDDSSTTKSVCIDRIPLSPALAQTARIISSDLNSALNILHARLCSFDNDVVEEKASDSSKECDSSLKVHGEALAKVDDESVFEKISLNPPNHGQQNSLKSRLRALDNVLGETEHYDRKEGSYVPLTAHHPFQGAERRKELRKKGEEVALFTEAQLSAPSYYPSSPTIRREYLAAEVHGKFGSTSGSRRMHLGGISYSPGTDRRLYLGKLRKLRAAYGDKV